jgi:pilus assembly protein CpaB
MARGYIQSQLVPTAFAPAAPSRTVVVAAQPLPFGATLTEENTKEIAWPSGDGLEGGFATRAELLKDGRRVALTSIERNEPILSAKITGAGQRAALSTVIDEGMRAVSVSVDDVRGVAGFVLPGDRVDVVLTRGDKSGPFADVLLQNVKVLAIDQLSNERQENPRVARAVTLELNMQQAQKVILAQGVGRLSLILRQAGRAIAESSRRVTIADLGLGEVAEQGDASNSEAKTAQDKGQASAVVAAPPSPPSPPRDTNVLVNVVRNGTRGEQYSVTTEGANQERPALRAQR